jgi:transcriptional regulator of acetoin/glycerol metabolism
VDDQDKTGTLTTRDVHAQGEAGARLLVGLSPDGASLGFRLPEQGVVTLGRSRGVDLLIDHTSVSRRHARLHLDGESVEIEDLRSRNGTRVRGTPLAPGERRPVAPGDVIDLGQVMLAIHAPAPSGEADGFGGDTERLVERVARSNISVLLSGETGVGKEVTAERIHRLSSRAHRRFVAVDCAALPEGLIENELFGHEKGAFTGAQTAKPGLLELADGGTVFLDELGEIPLAVQAKLLRVIEQREVLRVGGLKPRPIDVRFIAATHRDLRDEIAAGRFRQDLYFRLNGITVHLPPLRERKAEIASLAAQFLDESAGERRLSLSGEAIARLERHHWPGNVRELRNVINRALLLASGPAIRTQDIVFDELPASPESAPADDERGRILAALEACAGNQTRAAGLLGISRNTLMARLSAYGLKRPRKKV